MDPSLVSTTMPLLIESVATILDNLQIAVDKVESEQDKKILNDFYFAADNLSDLTLLVFSNCSLDQHTLKDADISAETVEVVMGILRSIAPLLETVVEFSQILSGSVDDDSDDDDDNGEEEDGDEDDENITSAIIQEYASEIVDMRIGIEGCSKALDVILCLTQVWLDVEFKANPPVLGLSLAILQESISTLENASSEPKPDNRAKAPSRLYSVAQSVYSSISAAHPATAPTAVNVTSSARNLFHTYICMGNCDEVEELLDAGLSAMAPGPQGLHPVHYAAFSGHLEIVRLLNRHGADMWAVAGPNGETPLLAAAAAGNLDVVEFLMGEEGADVDCASRAHGATPLLCACDHGHLDVARFLAMDKKADLFMPDKEGCTPLMKAVEAGHREVVEMLLEGVNVEELQAGSRRDGEDYMRAAMIRRELAAASVFLEKGVDGSFTPGKEKTPVQKAIGGGMSGVVEYLLSEALKVTNLSLEDMDSDSE